MVYEEILKELDFTVVDGIKLAKTVYYGELDYLKMSETVLFKNFTSRYDEKTGKWVAIEGREYLHNKREYMEQHKIDIAVPLSASKRVDLYPAVDDNKFSNKDFDKTVKLHKNYVLSGTNYRLQVETESHGWNNDVA